MNLSQNLPAGLQKQILQLLTTCGPAIIRTALDNARTREEKISAIRAARSGDLSLISPLYAALKEENQ